MQWDPERVRANVQKAGTEDLLDRATVYRAGMEEEALVLIEAELRRRGVSAAAITAHAEKQRVLRDAEGVARKCWKCRRPATGCRWGWHRLWGLVPIFPRRRYHCADHEPGGVGPAPSSEITSP